MKKLLRFFNTVTRTIETHQKTPTRGKRRKKKENVSLRVLQEITDVLLFGSLGNAAPSK